MCEILELDDILTLGNEGAPEEWLQNLTGEGIGGGLEGVNGDVIEALMDEDDGDDPLLPHLPIEATPEIQFYPCNTANYTSGRGGKSITHIVVHYTAGAITKEGAALANCKYFNRNRAGASAHYFIDSGYTIWQSVSESNTAWHAGNWAMNQRSIGIEVCSAGAFTEEEIARLAWLVQRLMQKYHIPASRVIRHYDVTKKKCPAYYVDAGRWNSLHARITAGSTTAASGSTSSSKPSSSSTAASSGKLTVDGKGGVLTIKKAQKVFGTPVDGKISNQLASCKKYLTGFMSSCIDWDGGKGGSSLVKAIQRWAGCKAIDGYWGKETSKAVQRKLGVTVDGYFGVNSMKAFQRWLNTR